MRFSYYTRDARDRDYTVIWRESRHDSVTDGAKSSVEGRSGDDFVQVTAPSAGSGPEVVLDVNTLDAGTGYLDLGLSVVSPDEDLLAYALDTSGDEVFTLRFRDLRTGEDLPDVVTGVGYTGAWSSDSETFLYTVPDASWRHERIRAHRLGTRPDEDRDVLVEPDRRFEVTVRRCRSEQAIVLLSESRDTSECWWVDPMRRRPGAAVPRRAAVRRELPRRARARRRWSAGPPARHRRRRRRVPAGLLPGARAGRPGPLGLARGAPRGARRAARARGRLRRSRRDHAAAGRRPDAARPPAGRPGRRRDRGDEPRSPAGRSGWPANTWYDAAAVAVTDESHTEPVVHAEVALADGSVTDAHRDEAPGHDPAAYVTEVRTFPAPDGTAVPATVVRHRDTPLDGTAPAVLFGYGAYEYAWEREWEEPLPSLLDRGVVFVHTHIRGGGEGGRRWWLDGRLTAKQHTFDDHLAVADGLADAGLVDPAPDR